MFWHMGLICKSIYGNDKFTIAPIENILRVIGFCYLNDQFLLRDPGRGFIKTMKVFVDEIPRTVNEGFAVNFP